VFPRSLYGVSSPISVSAPIDLPITIPMLASLARKEMFSRLQLVYLRIYLSLIRNAPLRGNQICKKVAVHAMPRIKHVLFHFSASGEQMPDQPMIAGL
jgi:hypothetical protein